MPTANAWSRTRAKLTAHHVKAALKLVASGAMEGRGHEWADETERGLVLRVGKTGGAWYLKTETRTVRLGDIDLPVAAAREAAQRSRVDLREGRNPSKVNLQVWGEAHRRGMKPGVARDAAFAQPLPIRSAEDRRREGPWEWQDLCELYLEKVLPGFVPRWATQFEKHLRRAVTPELARKRATDVDQADLLRVRDAVAADRTPSAAADTMEAVRAALDWAKRDQPILSGLARTPYPWWRDGLHVDWSSTPREHTPTVAELVRTLIIAERHRSLGGTAKETSEGMLAALWGIVLTGQRASALTATKRATVRAWPERPGWQIWTWTAAEMKGPKSAKSKKAARPHAVPIPPEALAVLARFKTDPESPFLFPSRVSGKAVYPTGLTQLFGRLQGDPKGGRGGKVTERPGADLFAAHDIRAWTPHDVRRTLGTFLDLEKLGGAGSAILAHKASARTGADAERELAASITLKHYIHSQRLDLKAEGMALWVAAVLEAYEAERARLGA
ncbi:integrase arm-type DNA-binding domain-containing protein [uncultured Methylobacterium sp.]|uniref:integrase arm-type DNA-binding domain-containing protein n=1 Tax=uncultured Methylobacterium sp. TaxID=157278 RepID=UPI0035C94D1D